MHKYKLLRRIACLEFTINYMYILLFSLTNFSLVADSIMLLYANFN